MNDERLLASLVLLLRLPSLTGDDFNTSIDRSAQDVSWTLPSDELPNALERDDGRLLCFMGRLINSYASNTSTTASNSSSELDVTGDSYDVKYSCLRLAVRIAFLRYAAPTPRPIYDTHHVINGSPADVQDDPTYNGVVVWELCLLKSLLVVTSTRTACCRVVEEVDVEMAWIIQGLLGRLSNQTTKASIDQTGEASASSEMWVQSIDSLISRRQTKGEMTSVRHNGEKLQSNETLMVQTINTILDGKDSSTINSNWDVDFNTSVASCIQSFLQSSATARLSQHAILGMIHWTQQTDSLSTDICWLTLQYLHHCLSNIDGVEASSLSYQQKLVKCQSYLFKDGHNTSKAIECIEAIRSFIFYGLVVLCNDPTLHPTDDNGTTQQPSSIRMSAHVMSGELYSLALELWQLLEPDWLYESPSNSNTNKSKWWWFSGNKIDEQHRLGNTWPLCTLVRLAAGEFRLNMGRWLTSVEDGKQLPQKISIQSELQYCARIVIQAVKLMTGLADEEDEVMGDATQFGAGVLWTPDAILHVRKSLEDALNTAVQFFNTVPEDVLLLDNADSSSIEDIGRLCCLVIGSIAYELEIDDLITSNDDSQAHDNSSFICALRYGIIFSHSLGEKRYADNSDKLDNERESDEYDEPLSYLLPCMRSLLTNSEEDVDRPTGDQVFSASSVLCEGGVLVVAISQFLHRLGVQWSRREKDVTKASSQRAEGILSLVELCTKLISGYLNKVESSPNVALCSQMGFSQEEYDKLSVSLELCRKCLSGNGTGEVRESVASTLSRLEKCRQYAK